MLEDPNLKEIVTVPNNLISQLMELHPKYNLDEDESVHYSDIIKEGNE